MSGRGEPLGVALGAMALGYGGYQVRRPYRVARFGERLDVIGSKRRWAAVEPADWKVTLTWYSGWILAVAGLVVLVVSL